MAAEVILIKIAHSYISEMINNNRWQQRLFYCDDHLARSAIFKKQSTLDGSKFSLLE